LLNGRYGRWLMCFLFFMGYLLPVRADRSSDNVQSEAAGERKEIQAYVLDVAIIVVKNNEVLSRSDNRRGTISGRPVSVGVQGGNMKLRIYIMPVEQQNEQVTLFISSESLIITDGQDNYYKYAEELTTEYGREVTYLPLGKTSEHEANILLKIIVQKQ
jgi:hypothetical protein